jgi:hypothetical protein
MQKKKKKEKKASNVNQVVEYLPSKHETLSSTHITAKNQNKTS